MGQTIKMHYFRKKIIALHYSNIFIQKESVKGKEKCVFGIIFWETEPFPCLVFLFFLVFFVVVVVVFCFFFLFFFGCASGMWKFPGQGSKLCHSSSDNARTLSCQATREFPMSTLEGRSGEVTPKGIQMKDRKKQEFPPWHSGSKDSMLLLLWLRFNPWPRNFHMPQVQPLKRERQTEKINQENIGPQKLKQQCSELAQLANCVKCC